MVNPTNVQNDITPLVIVNNGHPPINFTIKAGQGTSNLLRAGSVLAINAADSSKLYLINSGQANYDTTDFVLLKDVDTTSDVTAYPSMLLGAGIVNADKLIFGGSDTISTHYVALKAAGIVAVNPDSLEASDNT